MVVTVLIKRAVGSISTIQIGGELDFLSAPCLRSKLNSRACLSLLVDQKTLVFDLTEVSGADNTAIGVLKDFIRVCKECWGLDTPVKVIATPDICRGIRTIDTEGLFDPECQTMVPEKKPDRVA